MQGEDTIDSSIIQTLRMCHATNAPDCESTDLSEIPHVLDISKEELLKSLDFVNDTTLLLQGKITNLTVILKGKRREAKHPRRNLSRVLERHSGFLVGVKIVIKALEDPTEPDNAALLMDNFGTTDSSEIQEEIGLVRAALTLEYAAAPQREDQLRKLQSEIEDGMKEIEILELMVEETTVDRKRLERLIAAKGGGGREL